MMPTSVIDKAVSDQLQERTRLVSELGQLCKIAPDVIVNGCGQLDCTYFDDEIERCGLLVWDVPARLGTGALRWFVSQKRREPDTSLDETLATRCGCL